MYLLKYPIMNTFNFCNYSGTTYSVFLFKATTSSVSNRPQKPLFRRFMQVYAQNIQFTSLNKQSNYYI